MENNLKQKTAIRQLIEYLDWNITSIRNSAYSRTAQIELETIVGVLQKAKELEPVNEEQIKDAYNQGETRRTDAWAYFDETFEKP